MTRRALVLAGFLAVALPVMASAQGAGRPCAPEFERLGRSDVAPSLLQRQPSGRYNLFQGGGVRYRCQGQSVVIEADSLAYYGDLATVNMVGNVHYHDDDATLDSNLLTYYQNEEWVVVQGDVNARTTEGSTMRGPAAEYFRAVPGVRPVPRLSATGRPTLTLRQADSAGQPRPPVDVVADRVASVGESLVYAGGNVVITRPDLVARGDSATLNEERETARLMRNPVIEGRGDQPFTMSGAIIDLFSRDRQLERVLSAGAAHTVSEDVDLRSDTLDLRLLDGRLQRAFAWGPSRALATSPGRTIAADSLDARLPEQRLREVHAVGRARIETAPDSLKIRTTDRDWLAGDTIVAHFDSVAAPGDSARTPPLDSLVAVGGARSYQLIASDSGVTARPSIHYVRGLMITVGFDHGDVQRVDVVADSTGATTGVYLDAGSGAPAVDASAAQARPAPRGATPVRPPPPRPAPATGRPPGVDRPDVEREDRS